MLESLIRELKRDPDVCGVLLTGSRARGDALPGSDIDLIVLVASRPEKTFVSGISDGILVERHVRDVGEAGVRVSERPAELYSYLDGQIRYDPDGLLAELVAAAKERFSGYRVSDREKQAVFYWLKSASLKLRAAQAAGDTLRMGYYSSTNGWKVLEGLWALNDKPVPPAGAVWAHLPDLTVRPEGLEALLKQMFTGAAEERAGRTLELIDWVLEHAAEPPPRP